ncbi:uncharacterized protein NECHADRAFT_86028 [Fusarium vanettenii 77-13-4]|uniref:WSC domain-containing protein n=1 Tax=Fusarium vanettenii (strain ATCC MYA-4622 / CBS 123669 / FGSC 9596 / NRRL 45880 / 77-13-4) TaxID=660122 RepID=C7Z252_FUSV7|nr:uncharacterized protein NECHADRAFT_86028 [Fusarium vanettenii 77-13-4]EEU41940.1 hypothetical protein NECHADRAFT_86028 [Fusarium vanettenii 77-13-4]
MAESRFDLLGEGLLREVGPIPGRPSLLGFGAQAIDLKAACAGYCASFHGGRRTGLVDGSLPTAKNRVISKGNDRVSNQLSMDDDESHLGSRSWGPAPNMVAFKSTLLLLSAASTIFALPASTNNPEYGINGELLDSDIDKRSNYYAPPYPVCNSRDQNYRALKNNKAKGSAFCSAYLRTTKTKTVTPVVRKTTTKTTTKVATVQKTGTVKAKASYTVTAKATRTAQATVTKTRTNQLTDTTTKKVTGTFTNKVTSTATAQITETVTEQVTDSVTKQVTSTAAYTITNTVTKQVTSTKTEEITNTDSSTVTLTSTADTPTATVSQEYHCAINGYGTATYSLAGTSGSGITFDTCKEYCSGVSGTISFGFGGEQCACYNQPAQVNARPQASQTEYYFYDMGCPSANQPAKRDLTKRVQVPAYLPRHNPREVSSACSCLVTKAPAPATTTVTAKYPKTVVSTVLKCKTITTTKQRTVTVTDRKIYTATSYETEIDKHYKTITVINRNTATATSPVTVTTTQYITVTVTNRNTAHATNYNTAYFTNVNTVSSTDTEVVTATSTDYVTITQYDTVTNTAVAYATVTPDTVTVTQGTTYIYGS